ncbi:MAG: hypothetical protein KDJ36_15180 [Hyphomicrobiaceae bacterium]|nr:hypothetical protein [Hyphomicrobiaceae bacterium]
MSPSELSSEIRHLARVIGDAEDPRQAIRTVRDRVQAIKAQGRSVPAEIKQIEKRLMDECIAASQGR